MRKVMMRWAKECEHLAGEGSVFSLILGGLGTSICPLVSCSHFTWGWGWGCSEVSRFLAVNVRGI